ncbi:hypothetical protein FRC17_000183 [Serendipita sp. 399]|nr:hypothetical protein FRC17_000183 [Serendipita sp. 399]
MSIWDGHIGRFEERPSVIGSPYASLLARAGHEQAIEGQAEEAKCRAQAYRSIISIPAGVNSATNANTDEQLALGAKFLVFGAMENDELHRPTAGTRREAQALQAVSSSKLQGIFGWLMERI